MRTLNDAIYRVLQIAITFLMAALIVPVTMQIVSRYSEYVPRYIWTEEVARFCFMWIILLGSMIAVRDGTHFNVDVLPRAKTRHGVALQQIFVHVCLVLAALIFVIYGYPFALFGYAQESELTGINMLSIHIAWPLAGFVWLLFLAEKLMEDVRMLGEDGPADPPPPVGDDGTQGGAI